MNEQATSEQQETTQTARPLLSGELDDPLLVQDAMLVRMWNAREVGKGVRLSATEVRLLMGNALGNWSIEDSLGSNDGGKP